LRAWKAVEQSRYRRTVRVAADGKDHLGWIEVSVSAKKPALRIVRFGIARAGAAPGSVARQGADGSVLQSD
jgi:hypothetical protein